MHIDADWNREYVREVCDAIWDVEVEHQLLEWKVAGVYPWPLLRMPIYYAITQQLGFFGNPHPSKTESGESFEAPETAVALWKQLLTRERRARGGKTFWMRWLPGIGRTILVTHSRKLSGVDIYTQAVASQLGANSLVIDRVPAELPHGLDLKSIIELNRGWMKQVPQPEIDAAAHDTIDAALRALEQRLSVDLNEFRETFAHRVTLLSRLSKSYARFFELAKTKRLFVTDSYFSVPLMAGARAAGVKIVELQHGFISRYHLGYSYPRGQKSPYMADELWTFGQYWIDETPLPSALKTRVIGAPYVEKLAQEHGAAEKHAGRIVFTSQGAVGEQLLPLAFSTAQSLPNREVIFRLHPSESLADFEQLLAGREVPANFSLSAREPNIFALLASAEVQVGVFSTTLLEGMALGCRTAIVALPGFEYLDLVVERGDASIARSAEELVAAIAAAPLAHDASYYYAKPRTPLF